MYDFRKFLTAKCYESKPLNDTALSITKVKELQKNVTKTEI